MYENDFNHIYPTTAMFPGETFLSSIRKIVDIKTANPYKNFGFSTDCIQLCPQQLGAVNDNLLNQLKQLYPDTIFRLHANVTVDRHFIFDASSDLKNEQVQHYMAKVKNILNHSQ